MEIIGAPTFSVTYAPDYVGCDLPRRFFVELQVSDASAPDILVDDMVTLLDVNRNVLRFVKGEPQTTDVQRFYFQTKSNTPGTTRIRFRAGDHEIVVPVVIWSYENLGTRRLVNGVPVPFRYPLYREPLSFVKTRQTLTRDTQPPRTPQVDPRLRAALPSDDDLWGLLLDVGAVPRMHHFMVNIVGAGNRVADKIHPIGGLTRAEMASLSKRTSSLQESLRLWKYTLPEKSVTIPTNDLRGNDFHTGPFVDDGFNGLEIDGYRIPVLGMINTTRKDHLEQATLAYATQYQRTGDPEYAHKALVALSRMAVAYNYLSTMQHFRPYHHRWEHCSLRQRLSDKKICNASNTGIVDAIGIAECRKGIPQMAEAYDMIFPTLMDDERILPYLQSKGLPIQNVQDLQKLIEHGIFLSYLQHASVGQDTSNYPGTQETVATVIRVLDYPCRELVDLLYVGDKSPHSRTLSDSFVNTVFYYGYLRDGMKFENPGGYNIHSLNALKALELVNASIEERPEIFPKEIYPVSSSSKKLELALRNNIQCSSTPWTFVTVGDALSPLDIGDFRRDPQKKSFFGDERGPGWFLALYPTYRSPEIAWALANSSGVTLPANYPYTIEQLRHHAASLPPDWREGAHALAGTGMTLLRSGTGDEEVALYVPYQDVGHGSDIGLNLHLDGCGGRLISHWGYAPYASYGEPWYHSWASRNRGVIFNGTTDDKPKHLIGTNELLIATPQLMASDNRILPYQGRDLYDSSEQHRRVNVLVKGGTTSTYIVDLYRLHGGIRHLRSLNPTNGPCVTNGITLIPRPGTLAGTDVEYNDAAWARRFVNAAESAAPKVFREARALAQLYDVSDGLAPATPWTAAWNVQPQDGSEVDRMLRVHCLVGGDSTVALATAKDPNGHSTAVRRQVIWDHQCRNGAPLASQVLNLIEASPHSHPMIRHSEALPVTGPMEDGVPPVGFRVELADGRTDYGILSSAADTLKAMTLPDGTRMEMKGRIGFVSVGADGQVLAMNLLEGMTLTFGKERLELARAALTGTITAVDWENWTVDLDGIAAAPASLDERIMYVEKEPNLRLPLRMSNARVIDGRVRVSVDADPVVQPEFRVEKSLGQRFISGKLLRSSGRNANAVAIQGASGAFYRVRYFTPEQGLVLDESADGSRIAAEFPAGHAALVLDYAPGFSVTVPMATSYSLSPRAR